MEKRIERLLIIIAILMGLYLIANVRLYEVVAVSAPHIPTIIGGDVIGNDGISPVAVKINTLTGTASVIERWAPGTSREHEVSK